MSYWIGWPISPAFLSVTLLTIFKIPPFSLIVSGFEPLKESWNVLASLILFAASPVV